MMPIVPMIDILTILLIFFIIHTQWKKSYNYLVIDIASTEYMDTVESNREFDVLAVSADSGITFNSQSVELDDLSSVLKGRQEQNPGRMIRQDIDREVKFDVLIKVYDALTAAGVDVREMPLRINTKSKSGN